MNRTIISNSGIDYIVLTQRWTFFTDGSQRFIRMYINQSVSPTKKALMLSHLFTDIPYVWDLKKQHAHQFRLDFWKHVSVYAPVHVRLAPANRSQAFE